MDVETVLVAVDDSPGGTRAVEAAVAVADRYDAGVHVLYVLDRKGSHREEALMDDAEATAGDVPMTHSTATGFSTDSLRHHPGSVILDAADAAGVDFVVVPREDPAATLGKTAGYVVQYADDPVLSV